MNIKAKTKRNVRAIKKINDKQDKISNFVKIKNIIIYFNADNYLVKILVLLFIVNELGKKALLIFYLDLIIE